MHCYRDLPVLICMDLRRSAGCGSQTKRSMTAACSSCQVKSKVSKHCNHKLHADLATSWSACDWLVSKNSAVAQCRILHCLFQRHVRDLYMTDVTPLKASMPSDVSKVFLWADCCCDIAISRCLGLQKFAVSETPHLTTLLLYKQWSWEPITAVWLLYTSKWGQSQHVYNFHGIQCSHSKERLLYQPDIQAPGKISLLLGFVRGYIVPVP